jgi:hypothetical protein
VFLGELVLLQLLYTHGVLVNIGIDYVFDSFFKENIIYMYRYGSKKKKTTKPTKKQLKQKQRRQYQKQSVVVNVNTPVKRRSASGVKKSATVYPLAPQLIQSCLFNTVRN